jgi:hypothetical protein
MSAARFSVAVELRARWRATLGLVVLVGVVAGGAVAAAAGARRTQSAYPRFLDRYGAFVLDVSTGGDQDTDRIFDQIADLPQVVATSRSSLFVGALTARGHTVSFPDVLLVAEHETGSSRTGGVKVVAGRLPDPTAVNEAVAGYAFAERLGLEPGDTMTVSVASSAGEDDVAGRAEPVPLRLVGVVAAVGSFDTLTGRGFPNVVALTPAFFRAHRTATNTNDDTMSVALRHGEVDLPAFTDEINRRAIHLAAPPQPVSVYTADVQAVNQVPVVTLWAAAGLVTVAGVVILGQALAREALLRQGHFSTLRALGMSGGSLTAISTAKAALIGAGGAAVAVGVAVLASPLMPLGLARVAEPDPGFATDWAVFGVGAASTFLLVVAVSLGPARRAARRAGASGSDAGGRAPASAAVMSRADWPLSMLSGFRLATRASRPGEPVPVRSALAGTAFSIAAVTAAIVFGASLNHLVREPRLSGYSWDAAVIANSGHLDDVADSLPGHLVAKQWRGRVFASVRVDGLVLDASASEGPPPSIMSGRAPQASDELVLDPKTLQHLGKHLHDTVTVTDPQGQEGATAQRMRIVGSFAVPRLPFQSDQNPGQAAAFTPGGLASISGQLDLDSLFVVFRPGVDPTDGVQLLRESTAESAFAVFSSQRIGAVRGVQRISAAPWLLSGLLVILAIGTLAHTLLVTTRQRRKDLAILATLGFVSRQLQGAVAWLAIAIVAPALLIGLPLGILAGRWGWTRFASYLAVVPRTIAPGPAVVLVGVIAVIVTNAIAVGAAHLLTKHRPAAILRSE